MTLTSSLSQWMSRINRRIDTTRGYTCHFSQQRLPLSAHLRQAIQDSAPSMAATFSSQVPSLPIQFSFCFYFISFHVTGLIYFILQINVGSISAPRASFCQRKGLGATCNVIKIPKRVAFPSNASSCSSFFSGSLRSVPLTSSNKKPSFRSVVRASAEVRAFLSLTFSQLAKRFNVENLEF